MLMPNLWQARASLVIVLLALVFDLSRLWGALFLAWAIRDLVHRQTWMTEPVSMDAAPWLYAVIVFVWLLVGSYMLLIPLPWS